MRKVITFLEYWVQRDSVHLKINNVFQFQRRIGVQIEQFLGRTGFTHCSSIICAKLCCLVCFVI